MIFDYLIDFNFLKILLSFIDNTHSLIVLNILLKNN